MDLVSSSRAVRRTIVRMIHKSKSSHIGSALSMTDILVYLYLQFMRPDDKVIVSKWHGWSALYAVLAEINAIDKDWLIENYCQNGSKFWGHVTYGSVPEVHATGWSLGHGLPIGCGFALANTSRNVFVVTGDGELNEWSNWESAMFAYHHRLSNLVWIIDRNWQQSFGPTEETLKIHDLSGILTSFGWKVQTIDGNNFSQLDAVFQNLSTEYPNVIIANTIKGKGISFMEWKVEFHYRPPTDQELDMALQELSSN